MKILLIDENPIFSQRLQGLFAALGVTVVNSTANDKEALKKFSHFLPDVVVADVTRPLAVETMRLIKAKYPEVKTILLTASETAEEPSKAIKSGASGYLAKSLIANVFSEIPATDEQRDPPVKLPGEFGDSNQGRVWNDSAMEGENAPTKQRLSQRQKDVLILVAKGNKYKEIANRFGVSERTIKYYMKMILGRLHMKNRSQAVRYAIEQGFVD